MTAMTRTTGFPASIVAQMLAGGAIKKPGAYPVETGVPSALFIEEAKKRGFNLTWKLAYLDAPALASTSS
jgi:lysine 6-dehydrogenase